MRKLTTNQRKLAAWAGILGPAIFVATFTIEGWLRAGYNPLSTYVSALSLGPRGWIQMLNFLLLGLLLLFFSFGVAAEFPSGKASRWGVILLMVMGILFLISGPFVMDPMGTPQTQVTVHGTIHGIAGAIVFLLMPISCFVFLRRFREETRWRSFQWWTLALGILVAVAVVALSITSKSPSLINIFQDWFGLIQRFIIVPFMLWVFLFALRLLQQIK
jgi:Protein of unknown function (DUF998)